MDKLSSLKELFATNSQYKSYRRVTQECKEPIIPYLGRQMHKNLKQIMFVVAYVILGIHLVDLTFIDDGNSDLVDKLINVWKLLLISKHLHSIVEMQHFTADFDEVKEITQFIELDMATLYSQSSDDQLFKRSLELQPRLGANVSNK